MRKRENLWIAIAAGLAVYAILKTRRVSALAPAGGFWPGPGFNPSSETMPPPGYEWVRGWDGSYSLLPIGALT